VSGLGTGSVEELPNEFAAFSPVILQRFVGPFAGDEDAAAGDAEVFGLVGLALAPSRDHGVPGAVGLDAVEKPHRAPRRARGNLQFRVQPPGMVTVGVDRVLIKSGSLPDTLGEVFGHSVECSYVAVHRILVTWNSSLRSYST
jgi:hypothetical protein